MPWYLTDPGFTLGPFTLYWYGIIVTLAILTVYLVTLRRATQAGIEARHLENLFLILVPSAIVGARTYHVLETWSYYQNDLWQIFNLRAGGLAFFGGLIGGVIGLWLYARQTKLPVLKLLDLAAPGIALGQAIGRWGNFFNQELYGAPTNLPWKLYIEPQNRLPEHMQDAYYHPTFLYESLLNVISALALWLISRQLKDRRPGFLFGIYLINYGLIRFLMEWVRIDEATVLGPFKLAQFFALGIMATGVLLVQRHLRVKSAASSNPKAEVSKKPADQTSTEDTQK